MKCLYCDKEPHQITEYLLVSESMGVTPEEAVRLDEDSYSEDHQLFTCMSCFVRIGMPAMDEIMKDYDNSKEGS